MNQHLFCVAPMMEWTDRHCRYFLRLISKRALLYTEMVTADAVLRGDRNRLLQFHVDEHPVALQVGGSDAGSLAEALLLTRHSDSSERGPGLAQLVGQATRERLFGRDTLRQLETLNDYRDLIHTRAGPRNKIQANEVRMEHAVQAVKLLCAELQDLSVRFA